MFEPIIEKDINPAKPITINPIPSNKYLGNVATKPLNPGIF